MARLRQRKNSDPENFTQGGGRAAGGATRGGRAARGEIGGGRGGNNNIPRAGGTYTPGDANLDIMRIIQEEAQKRDEDITKGGEDTGNGRKKKNRVNDNTNVNNRNLIWFYLLGIFATYSSAMAPLTCAFNAEEYLPYQIIIVMEFAFIVDILRGLICAYHDNQPIANDRFLHWKLELVAVAAVPLANILQWEYLRWINIVRAMRGKELLEKLEKVESFNYAFIMFIKIMAIQLYCIHTTGCMLYQLATDFEGLPQIYQTWMSDIQIGNQNLSGLGNVQKYIASTYFATVTLSTVGYGDIHATNLTEMVALACLIIVSLTVWTYLGVQLANLFGRRSKKQIVGEKMDNLEKYLKEAKIAENLAEDIRGHMQMKYSDDYDRKILEDVPACLIAKINKNFNESIIRSVSLFNGCSPEFFKHLASGAQQDFHPPGCTVLKEGNIVSQLHILYKGGLELLQGGTVHPPLTRPTTVFGLESFVLNEPLPHTIRTYKASKFLIISKKYFMECLHNYLEDGASVMRNLSNGRDPAFVERLLQSGRDPAFVERLLQSVFGIQMQKDVIRKASLLNHAIFFEDLEKVKKLIHWGVSMDSVDYNNKKPLDFAINRGNTEIISFLMSVVAETNTTGIDQEHAD
ncbi:hypothetical protein F2Q69_00038035 [Brassica cretica]|uniref:Cyclic nucleotide-binding domain-containing protein n=1 Tax=Brassica cretica TaxID=69181 RepID=A0A8S9SCQ4_BRACR|nr:hypothetical protein F2Q69_00038035 [Brassica cretica]